MAAMSERHNFTVGETDQGERLDRWLARVSTLSRTQSKRLIEAGAVVLDGIAVIDPAAKVRPGQGYALTLPEPAADRPAAQPMALIIPYEDDDLLVVDKPAGLVVHPAPGNPDHTLVNALIAHCGEGLRGIGGVKRPGIVHRLDKDTSGLMVVAKTDLAHRKLSEDFAARRIERAYTAIVWGVPPAAGEIEGAIGRSPRDRKKMALVAGGKPAITRFRRVASFGTVAARLECRLATGRTHQIRVHLSSSGHPLIGDPTYGRSRQAALSAMPPDTAGFVARFPRQALHAFLLGFAHLADGRPLRFTSALPDDLQELLRHLAAV